MTVPVSRSTVQAFYMAYVSRDPARIAAFLDDGVHWMVSGPADLLPFCGEYRGKQAVFDYFAKLMPSIFEFRGFEPHELLVDGDRAALIGRLSGIQRSTGRMICYRAAQFLQFRDDKVVRFHSLLDSFDAAEQMLGHSIRDVAQMQVDDDLVAV